MSQEKLADRAGLHRTQVSAIERGRSNVMVDTLVSLAPPLGVDSVELIIERDEEPVPRKGTARRRGISELVSRRANGWHRSAES